MCDSGDQDRLWSCWWWSARLVSTCPGLSYWSRVSVVKFYFRRHQLTDLTARSWRHDLYPRTCTVTKAYTHFQAKLFWLDIHLVKLGLYLPYSLMSFKVEPTIWPCLRLSSLINWTFVFVEFLWLIYGFLACFGRFFGKWFKGDWLPWVAAALFKWCLRFYSGTSDFTITAHLPF